MLPYIVYNILASELVGIPWCGPMVKNMGRDPKLWNISEIIKCLKNTKVINKCTTTDPMQCSFYLTYTKV